MNHALLREMLHALREYPLFTKALTTPYGKELWRPALAEGLCDGAFLLFTSTVADDITSGKLSEMKRLLIVCPEDKEASRLNDYLSDAGLPSFFYPARDFNFNNMTASHDVEHERLSVLCRLLLTDAPTVICTTVEAAMQRTVSIDVMFEHAFQLTLGNEISLEKTSVALTEAGYKRVALVESAGQYSIRGGIIDIFPPGDMPVRCELFGDEIDRMGYFDVLTQRTVEELDTVVIPPANETVVSEEAKKRLKDVISQRILKNKKSASFPEETETRLKKELSDISNSGELDFIDKYIDTVYDDFDDLTDYFEGFVCVWDSSLCFERLNACRKLLEESAEEMVRVGEISLSGALPWMSDKEKLLEKMRRCPSFFSDIFTRSYNDIAVGEIFDFFSQTKTGYSSDINRLLEDLEPYVENKYKCVVFTGSEAEERNLFKTLFDKGFMPVMADDTKAHPLTEDGDIGEVFRSAKGAKQPVALLCGSIPSGFDLTGGSIALFDFSSDSMSRKASLSRKIRKKRDRNAKAIISYHDLEPGDYVVHDVYGIGLYEGIENLTIDGVSRDYVNIRYAGKDKLFLPVDQLDMVAKYVGATDEEGSVKLSKMGGADWARSKARAKSAAKDIAKELIQLYAKRKRTPGIAFEPDDAFSRQFADAFAYEETDSQLAAIADISADMEKPYPMDRMICGDVGYGKTEVAMRAAFKAVSSGYQVAVLVPTTILAFQHFQTFSARFRGFPISIDVISRLSAPSKRSESLRKLKRGETDIIIGTHRLISKDVEFKKLGLIIIDEEQRFGVQQKEKLKQLCPNADVLTLTATPIPRTLNMAIGGLMDMSVLDDVPGLRSPVQTYVMEHDDSVLYEAVRRELRRGGQVFWLHNRIDSIYAVANRIQKALPDARIAVGHGKLDKNEIEEIWSSLIKGEIDILVSTTIIESGIDVPRANTLIIDRADKYGLSQLHQIRGRVGRSSRKAYAYFTYPPAKVLSEVAEKRLRAVKEYASFGAGFKIAMRDMEIRGVGNLLGSEQHGHMDSVGYDMYLKLLNEAVLEETGEVIEKKEDCAVSVKADAFIPKNYIPDSGQRMEMYKKIARIGCLEDFDDVIDEFCDRFGDIPSPALSLCRIAYMRSVAVKCNVRRIDQYENEVRIVPGIIDPFILNDLARSFPRDGVRYMKGAAYTVCFRIPRGKAVVEYATEIVERYLELIEEADEAAKAALPADEE